jgi:hypothetical protein
MVLQSHPQLADYFHKFLMIGQSVSYTLTATSSTPSWPTSNLVPEPSSSTQIEHKARSSELFKKLQADALVTHSSKPTSVEIRPFLQAGHLDIREESDYVVPYLLSLGRDQGVGSIDWTSGYFSLDAQNQRRLLDAQVDRIRVVCASPEVRGGLLIRTF